MAREARRTKLPSSTRHDDTAGAADPKAFASPVLERLLRVAVPGYAEKLGRSLWILFVARIVNSIAFSSSFPFLAAYLATDRAVAATAVGALYMAQGVSGALFQLVGGELAMRFGRRSMLVFSLGVRSLVSVGMGVAIHNEAPVLLLALLVLTNGMLAGIFQPAADALVTELARGEKRISAFAHQRVAINVGWAAGPLMGGLVAGGAAFEMLFLLAAPLILTAAWLVSRLTEGGRGPVPPRENPLRAIRTQLGDRSLQLQLAGALLLFLLAGQMIVTLSVEAASRLSLEKHQLGFLWTLNGLIVVLLQMPFARLVRRIGTHRALLWSAVFYALGYASVGFASSWNLLILAMCVVTAGELLNAPSQQTAVVSLVRPENASRVLGLLGLTMMLGRSSGPLVGGAAHDLLGGSPRFMWGAISLLGVAAAAIYVKTGRLAKERELAAAGATDGANDGARDEARRAV